MDGADIRLACNPSTYIPPSTNADHLSASFLNGIRRQATHECPQNGDQHSPQGAKDDEFRDPPFVVCDISVNNREKDGQADLAQNHHDCGGRLNLQVLGSALHRAESFGALE